MDVKQWLGEENTIGIDIWEKKYRYNGESFEEWLTRVSNSNDDIKQLIRNKKFLFGGRILANRGVNDSKLTLSNCYVISTPEDNLESIYDTCKKLARTYSYGGGCGIDISKLAPAGARVRNQAKSTSGAVSFMDTFSQVTGQIGQCGRRGALMISIECTHPDLEKFITVKSDLDKINFANISVKITNDFMKAVEKDLDWELSFTRKETGEVISKTVKAKEIFNLLCEQNWNYAEPGILFWNRINDYNLLSEDKEFSYASVNPCAEEPLPAGGSCLLGALNLSAFVDDNSFAISEFQDAVRTAVFGLNEVLLEGLPKHPLQEQRDTVNDWRQIGLGILGLADMLIKLGVRYGSQEAVDICDDIGQILAETAIKASVELAENFQAYPKCKPIFIAQSEFFKDHANDKVEQALMKHGIANSQLLTIAPTGSLSTMLGVSGGIEPIFANSYTRTTKSLHNEDKVYKIYTPIVQRYMDEHSLTKEEELPDFFITSSTISVDERIAMQAVWQKHIDASISSTVNLPEEATVDDVYNVYFKGWQQGLKGVTVFRAGCKRIAILNTENNVSTDEDTEHSIVYNTISPVSRSTIGDTYGKTYCKKTACGTLYITVNHDSNNNIVETFISTSKGGICQANISAVNRLVSLNLRSGVKISEIVKQLKGISCPVCAKVMGKNGKIDGISCSDILGRTIEEFYKETTNQELEIKHSKQNTSDKKAYCPECGYELITDEGCVRCPNCQWGKCKE